MRYEDLHFEEFDAVVTGELTHYALHLEDCLDDLVCNYFVRGQKRRLDFKRLMMHRDGLTFQDKIEIVRAMAPIFGSLADSVDLKGLLKRIEAFKSYRNALAHGRDHSSESSSFTMRIEVVSRSGKEKLVEITPASHQKMCSETENLLEATQKACKELLAP